MKRRIINVTNSLKPLTTYQDVNFDTSWIQPMSDGASQTPYSLGLAPLTANRINAAFNNTGFVTQGTKIWIKRVALYSYLTNYSTYPCMVEINRYRLKRDAPGTFTGTTTVLNDSVISVATGAATAITSVPYVSVNVSAQSHKYYKILSVKTFELAPGKTIKIKVGTNRWKTPIITGDGISDGTNVAYGRGTPIAFVRVYGKMFPVPDANSVSATSLLGPLNVGKMQRYYISFRAEGDGTINSWINNSLPGSIPTQTPANRLVTVRVPTLYVPTYPQPNATQNLFAQPVTQSTS